MSVQDKSQVGFSEEGRKAAEEIQEAYPFSELKEVYRFGIAVALAKELEPAPEDIARRTTFGVGTLDPDGKLKASIEELRDDHDGRPYALGERLAEAGILVLATHARAGKSLREFLEPIAP